MDTANRTADIVIIGAGVMGASLAYHLAQRRAGRVLLLERQAVASAASGRSSALVRMHYCVAAEVRLAVKSLEYFTHWSEWLDRPDHYRRTGFVRIVPSSEINSLRANVKMQRECGADARLLTREELHEIEPHWYVDDVELAAYEPDSGYGDAVAVATDFLDRARELGVSYRPGTQVHALKVDGSRVTTVVTDSDTIEAGRVVVAAGAWSRRLFQRIGIDLPLETEYHEVAILERPPEMRDPHLAGIDSTLQIYFRSEGQSQSLVGDFYGRRGVDPDRYPSNPPLENFAEKIHTFSRRIPAMAEAGIVRGITGIYTMTPDSHGLMGKISSVDGLYTCTGFSGMGFKISPAAGLAMAELLLDGKATTVDISDFRPERFAEGRPIRGPYEYQDD